jgi:hypothetical protein
MPNDSAKTVFRVFWASRRGGEIICRMPRNRIEREGTCVFYREGNEEIRSCHSGFVRFGDREGQTVF